MKEEPPRSKDSRFSDRGGSDVNWPGLELHDMGMEVPLDYGYRSIRNLTMQTGTDTIMRFSIPANYAAFQPVGFIERKCAIHISRAPVVYREGILRCRPPRREDVKFRMSTRTNKASVIIYGVWRRMIVTFRRFADFNRFARFTCLKPLALPEVSDY